MGRVPDEAGSGIADTLHGSCDAVVRLMCGRPLSYNPQMRRRWYLLAVIGAVVLLASLLLLLPVREDGLDWVRKYGGTEQSVDLDFETKGGSAVRSVTFTFAAPPAGLEQEARIHVSSYDWDQGHRFTSETKDGWTLSFSGEGRELTFVRELNWFERMLGKLNGRHSPGPEADGLTVR